MTFLKLLHEMLTCLPLIAVDDSFLLPGELVFEVVRIRVLPRLVSLHLDAVI